MAEAFGGPLTGLSTWLLTYLAHSTVVLSCAWLLARTGLVRRPRSLDVLWKVALLAGVVTATGAHVRTLAVEGAPRESARLHLERRLDAGSAGASGAETPERARMPAVRRANDEGVRVAGVVRGSGNEVVAPEGDAGGHTAPSAGSGERAGAVAEGLGLHRASRPSGAVRSAADVHLVARGRTQPGGTVRSVARFTGARVDAPGPACRAALGAGGLGQPAWEARVRSECMRAGDGSWRTGLLIGWAAGVLVGVLALARSWLALRALRGTLVAPTGELAVAFDAARGGLRGVRARVMCSPAVDAPCVIDGRTIVLPDRCAADLDARELRAVLAHEIAHVARADVAWQTVFRFVTAALWLQPLNRVALSGIVDAAEQVCDDWAVRRTRAPLDLARSISRVAEWKLSPAAAAVTMAGRNRGSLTERVRRILAGEAAGRPEPRWRLWLPAVALVVPALLLPAVPGPAVFRVAVFVDEVEAARPVEGGARAVPADGPVPGPSGDASHVVLLRVGEGALAGLRTATPASGVFVSRLIERGPPGS